MLPNPFTPAEIASAPEDFFGRGEELHTLERSLQIGSVAIQGPIGIGKSSLLARGRLMMEGFGSEHHAKSVVAVGDKNVETIDDAARLLLECFVDFDEQQHKARFKIGSFLEIESVDVVRFFAEGRHLSALKRVLEAEYLRLLLRDTEMLVLAIDEADKAPVALARVIRSIVTHTQQSGVKNVRFALAGVNPFFQTMVYEDPGVSRFFYKTITLEPMTLEDSTDLIETKLETVVARAERGKIALTVDPTVITRIVALSGGHPHILQLLGSHLVEHEDSDPDNVLDARDLTNSLRRICYEDRARVYDATIHHVDLYGHLEDLRAILSLAKKGFPTSVSRRKAVRAVGEGSIAWLVNHNILSVRSDDDYGLVDEFLRVRLVLDSAESASEQIRVERELIRAAGHDIFRDRVDPYEHENLLIDRIDHPEDYE